jgi:hypothetical protein
MSVWFSFARKQTTADFNNSKHESHFSSVKMAGQLDKADGNTENIVSDPGGSEV